MDFWFADREAWSAVGKRSGRRRHYAERRRPAPLKYEPSLTMLFPKVWALYAEQLADELGGYASPVERAGYLQSFLFRAAPEIVIPGAFQPFQLPKFIHRSAINLPHYANGENCDEAVIELWSEE